MVGWRFTPDSCWPARVESAPSVTPWYTFTWLPMTVVSPMTTPVAWSMKKYSPTCAPALMSTPVPLWAYSVMMRGMRGTPCTYSSWAMRYTKMAKKPG